jgi:hypothetical protein
MTGSNPRTTPPVHDIVVSGSFERLARGVRCAVESMGEGEATDSTEQEPPCAGTEDPDGPGLSPFEGEDMLDYQIQPLRWKYDLAVKA